MTVRTLERPPALLPLFARAVLTSRGRGGDTIAPTVYETVEQPIDLARLADYQRVCGFRTGDVLPPTYLHVLAFPLSVARMVERDFPFPLVGLVHVANSITQVRPVRLGELVSLRVEVANLRPHAAGQQLDVLTSAYSDGGEVWTSTSTYLHRGKKPSSTPTGERERSAPSGASTIIRVPADIGRRYAAVAGDRNPIHLHALTARVFGFPKAIAHGMWLEARALATLEGRLPPAFTVDVAFKTPVFLPSTVELLTARTEPGWTLDLRNARSGKPHLAGTISSG
jgi:acyl dehydratase